MGTDIRSELERASVPFRDEPDLDAVLPEVDVVYQTRVQKERFTTAEEYEAARGQYIIDTDAMRRLNPDAILLHPLPRVGEITVEVDADPARALALARAGADAVNVPIIYFSVRWWNTLHQGSTISLTAAPKMATTMLVGMLLMTAAFWAYSFAVAFTRARAIVLEQEQDNDWVHQLKAAGRGDLKHGAMA